jgi:cytidine deaminase
MSFLPLTPEDQKLIEAARDVLERNYHPVRHSVGAVLCASGRIYAGINVEACGYGPCAEPIAIGAALSNGEREILAIVAVFKGEDGYTVLPPCGNCRQLLVDYAPEAMVIFSDDGQVVKTQARNCCRVLTTVASTRLIHNGHRKS